jgi:multidrug resistance efflux pump
MPTQIQTDWTTGKAALATATATYNTLQTNLQSLEASCEQLEADGAQDVAAWLRLQMKQLNMGYEGASGRAAYMVAGVAAFAINTAKPQDVSRIDARPISSTATGAAQGLS